MEVALAVGSGRQGHAGRSGVVRPSAAARATCALTAGVSVWRSGQWGKGASFDRLRMSGGRPGDRERAEGPRGAERGGSAVGGCAGDMRAHCWCVGRAQRPMGEGSVLRQAQDERSGSRGQDERRGGLRMDGGRPGGRERASGPRGAERGGSAVGGCAGDMRAHCWCVGRAQRPMGEGSVLRQAQDERSGDGARDGVRR